MYQGMITEWLQQEKNNSYEFDNNGDLIAKYLDILWHASHPLYVYQVRDIKQILDSIEANINDDIVMDLHYLGDKDLCLKYDLDPKIISSKYIGVSIDNIKPSLKTELLGMREDFMNQYKEYQKDDKFKNMIIGDKNE